VAVETAKAIVEIPSPCAGRIGRLFGGAGDMIRVGAPLVEFEGAGADDAGTVVGAVESGASILREAPTSFGRSGGSVRVVPAARALARKLDVDLAMVTPSGADGVITPEDVQRVARILSETEPAEPLRGPRRAMAQNMAFAQAEVAPATIMEDAVVDAWEPGTDVTIRLIRALVKGCHAEPGLNCWFESATLSRRLLRKIDLGIAVDMPEGLFVPVMRDVGNRDSADLRKGLDRMRKDIAERRIPPEELRGATITLSNFGTIAGRYAAPVVLPPAVAILGAGRIRSEVKAIRGAPVVLRVLPLSLTFDHRVVSGGEAGRFLSATISDLALAS
jgi:2-oxoisovalerate dehydrogenase E2 component (dihydrolipoyl transacylase)